MRHVDQLAVAEHCRIFEYITGSRLYGTDTEASDTDYAGIYIAPPEQMLSPFCPPEPAKGIGDRILHELSRFMSLLVRQIPNALEALFVDEEYILCTTPEYQEIRWIREHILSSLSRKPYGGYATAQMRRLKNAADALQKTGETRAGRNEKRAALELMHGYDTKHAMHMIRVLHAGIDLQIDGIVKTRGPNVEHLRDILQGKFTLHEVLAMYEDLSNQLKHCATVLPDTPDIALITSLSKDLYQEHWQRNPMDFSLFLSETSQSDESTSEITCTM